MKGMALILVLCITAFWAVSAYAYEFKLLNGMKVKGGLKSFNDGRFVVDTDFGSVTIDADKLDYIIVEASDPGPCQTPTEQGTPGLGLCHIKPPSVKGADPAKDIDDEAPQPLADRSIAPAPLTDHSVMPAPGRPPALGTFSAGAAKAHQGRFRGFSFRGTGE